MYIHVIVKQSLLGLQMLDLMKIKNIQTFPRFHEVCTKNRIFWGVSGSTAEKLLSQKLEYHENLKAFPRVLDRNKVDFIFMASFLG